MADRWQQKQSQVDSAGGDGVGAIFHGGMIRMPRRQLLSMRTLLYWIYIQYRRAMKDPLTREELKAIQGRGLDSADVRALLWEVFRLRALTLRTHDYFRQAPTSSTALMLLERLRGELDAEPVVKEQPKL